MPDFRIVFMGTPEFAVPSLEILVKNGCDVAGVVTAPDKAKGRGRRVSGSPVKEFAMDHDLRIWQPENLKDLDFIGELNALSLDLIVVVAFRKLPEQVWRIPVSGTINLHASLLPQYRGAAPINWAIINGETNTGVTTFFINEEIDKGKLIMQEEEPIFPADDAGDLYNRLMIKGAGIVLKTVKMIANGEVNPSEQLFVGNVKPAPKINKEICRIDFGKTASEIHNLIRGLSPEPGAWTIINLTKVKIFKSKVEPQNIHDDPGYYVTDNKDYLKFQTGSGVIDIIELQSEGKRRMDIKEFLRGNKL